MSSSDSFLSVEATTLDDLWNEIGLSDEEKEPPRTEEEDQGGSEHKGSENDP